MSEFKRNRALSRQVIHLDDSDERFKLLEEIEQVQRDEHCVKRAAFLMVLLLCLSLAGLGYGTIMIQSFPYGGWEVLFKFLCEVGLASLMTLLVLFGLLILYRQRWNRLREDCRGLIA